LLDHELHLRRDIKHNRVVTNAHLHSADRVDDGVREDLPHEIVYLLSVSEFFLFSIENVSYEPLDATK